MTKAEEKPEELGYQRYRQIMDQEERTQVSLDEEKIESINVETNLIIVFGNSQKSAQGDDLFEAISEVMLDGYDKS